MNLSPSVASARMTGPLPVSGQLHGLVLDTAVVIGAVRDLDIDALRAGGEMLDAGGLLFDDRCGSDP